MKSFKYLEYPHTLTDFDWSEVISNLLKARKSWYILSRIMGQEGAATQTLGNFYLAIVKAVLLFGT